MRKLLLAILVVSCYYTTQAQQTGKVEFGLKGGLSIANMTDWGFSVYGYRPIPAFNGGALLNIKFNDRPGGIALQPEVVFSRQGGVASATASDGSTYNYTTHLDYINVPVLMIFQASSGFRFEMGPQFGILLSAGETGYGLNGDVDRKNIYYPTDFSWVFGLGYVARSGFGFDARGNFGMSNINSDRRSGEDDYMNNTVFQIGLFYQIGHDKYSRYSHNSRY